MDNVEQVKPTERLVWMNKPKIESWKYVYRPTYSNNGKNLLFNYLESDDAYKERIKEKFAS